MKASYYICLKCGCESAFYEQRSKCPVCRGEKTLVLIGQSDDPNLMDKIERYRLIFQTTNV